MAEEENKTIIFIETKRRVDEVTKKIKREGYELSFILIKFKNAPLAVSILFLL